MDHYSTPNNPQPPYLINGPVDLSSKGYFIRQCT